MLGLKAGATMLSLQAKLELRESLVAYLLLEDKQNSLIPFIVFKPLASHNGFKTQLMTVRLLNVTKKSIDDRHQTT